MLDTEQIFELLEKAVNNIITGRDITEIDSLVVSMEDMKNLILAIHIFLIDGLSIQDQCYWNLVETISPHSYIDSTQTTKKSVDYNQLCFEWLLTSIEGGTLSSLITILSTEFNLLEQIYCKNALIRDHDKIIQMSTIIQNNLETNTISIKTNNETIVSNALSDFYTFRKDGYEYFSILLHQPKKSPPDVANIIPEVIVSSAPVDTNYNNSAVIKADEQHVQTVSEVKESINENGIACDSVLNQGVGESVSCYHNNLNPSLEGKNYSYQRELVDAMNANDDMMNEEIYSKMGLSKTLINQNFNCEFMGFSAEEELLNSINACKMRILSPSITSGEKEKLVELLVQLRWNLYNLKNKDALDLPTSANSMGHSFFPFSGVYVSTCGPNYRHKIQCEACYKNLGFRLSKSLQCKKCFIIVHKNCVNALPIPCIGNQTDSFMINYKICPEIGMNKQSFRCGFCKVLLIDGKERIRKCDYSGLYYCSKCHTGDLHMIPARIIRNWDFTCFPVSRCAFTLLQLIWNKHIIDLSKVSNNLMEMAKSIQEIQAKRKHLCMYQYYLEACKLGLKNKIYQELQHRLHLLEDKQTYTFADLTQIHDGKLLKFLEKIDEKFLLHIKKQCPNCYDLGHLCLICRSSDNIYPFDNNVILCPNCNGVFHKKCFDPLCCVTCARNLTYKKTSA